MKKKSQKQNFGERAWPVLCDTPSDKYHMLVNAARSQLRGFKLMCGGFFHPFFPQNSSSSVDFRAVLHELHFWGEFFDGVSAGGLWWPWLGPFEALHCKILDVFGVIILLQELSSFHLQLGFFLGFFEQTVWCVGLLNLLLFTGIHSTFYQEML